VLAEVADFDPAAWVGRTDRALAEFYSRRLGTTAADLERRGEMALMAELSEGVAAFPDAVAALGHASRAGMAVAVVSNSRRWRLDAVLAAARLDVATTVASDEVPAPKPAPDLYLAAARLVGVDPGGCLVFEDSVTGVRAAQAAGMRVVGVERHGSGRSGASRVTDDVMAALIADG